MPNATQTNTPTHEQIIEVATDFKIVAFDYFRSDILEFARYFFKSHLTIAMPRYHERIYTALQALIGPPATPPRALEMVNGPPPKSLAISKVSKRNDNNLHDESSTPRTDETLDNAGEAEAPSLAPTRAEIKQIFRNSVVVEPREFGKSTKAMIFVMWALMFKHKKFVLYISKSHDHAVKLIGPIKREFESNEDILDTFGDLRGEKWTEGEMDFKFGGKLLAIGRGQTVRGLKFLNWRPDLVILDDIEDDKEVENKELRLANHEWLDKQVMPGVDSKSGNIAAFGTILHPDSLLSHISRSENRLEKYANFNSLFFSALDANDRSIWEEKFTTEQLHAERKRDYMAFAQERMNQPIPIGSGMFKKDYFRYFTLKDDTIYIDGREIALSSCNLYLTCDIAITKKEYSDYTVLLVSAVSPDNEIFVLDYTRERWEDPSDIMKEMFRLNAKYPGIITNGVEEVAAQRWLIVNLRKEMKARNKFFSITPLKADKEKVRRISQLQPRFENGAVYLKAHMSELEEELLLFPKSAHDDVSDALAYVLQIARPGEKVEEVQKKRGVREPYKFSISGEEVLRRLHERTKPQGIFKEYAVNDDYDPYEGNEFDEATVNKWED